MKTYHEKTGELIESPDLEKGYTYPGQKYLGTERVKLRGTVELYPPDGLGYDKPVYEDCLYYHTYTEDELAAQHTPDEPQPSDGVATWNELAAAYSEGVASVGQ